MVDPYAKLVRTVDKVLGLYGKGCELVQIVPGGYDPATGTVTGDTEETYMARVFETGYTLDNLGESLVETGSKIGVLKVTDAAFSGAITMTMRIRLAGDKLRNLTEIQPIMPGPQCLYWKFIASA